MIYEYALEPDMVATWGELQNYRFFLRAFGQGQGRIVSRYPKKWAAKVWDSFETGTDMDRKRLEELLVRFKETMIKRKDVIWDDKRSWVENALHEHARYPFSSILAKNNPENYPEILREEALGTTPCPSWDIPHGLKINRNIIDMATAVRGMLSCCRWVKFIDPYLSPRRHEYKTSLRAFLKILVQNRAVGPPESIEIHSRIQTDNVEFIQDSFKKFIPAGLKVAFFQWKERKGGQRLHNRYILSDLGGVSFLHGLDTGKEGETDDINRLDFEQYIFRCDQYDTISSAFDKVIDPIEIVGTSRL